MGVVLKVKMDTKKAKVFLDIIEQGLEPKRIDLPVDKAAFLTLPEAKQRLIAVIGVRPDGTRWFLEKPEDRFLVQKPRDGVREIVNGSKVASMLEFGTANKGTGWVLPKVKKALFIPLKRKAAGGWTPDLKIRKVEDGQVVEPGDYMLVKRVRGIRPRPFMDLVRLFAREKLMAESREYLRQLMRYAWKVANSQAKAT